MGKRHAGIGQERIYSGYRSLDRSEQMSMDLTGIRNINEYYTNHYLASIFAENVKETLSGWREKSQETGESTPWARLREVGRRYYVLKDRYAREPVSYTHLTLPTKR